MVIESMNPSYYLYQTALYLEEYNPDMNAVDIKEILEDNESPLTRKLQSRLYQMIVDRAHVDFDTIPKSKGDISKYTGYETMLNTLSSIREFAHENNNKDVSSKCDLLLNVIDLLYWYRSYYERAFKNDIDKLILEYNVFVYTLVDGTSALLYTYIDFVKNPNLKVYEIKLKNTKTRADLFIINQIETMEKVLSKKADYSAYLEAIIGEKNNFLGSTTAIGIATTAAVALAIVPVTKELIFQFYAIKAKLSTYLEQQSKFLEMNATRVSSSNAFDAKKRASIVKKQNAIAVELMKLSDTLKVVDAKASIEREKMSKNDNKVLSIGQLKDELNSSPIELL